MEFLLDCFDVFYMTGAVGMSLALNRFYPELDGWGNVARSLGWPVTIYEVKAGLLD